jgi:hypothetical protein
MKRGLSASSLRASRSLLIAAFEAVLEIHKRAIAHS